MVKPSVDKMISNMLRSKNKVGGGGVADDIPAMIDGTQPAAISAGEYIIPADVVSMIGDGDTDSGARILDELISEIRKSKSKNNEKQPPMLEEALRAFHKK